jgi:hypothetical protein
MLCENETELSKKVALSSGFLWYQQNEDGLCLVFYNIESARSYC